MNAKKKILLVDDHPVVRDGLALRIGRQADLSVCGEADSPATAMQRIAETGPDLVVVDLLLKDGSGLELIRDIKGRYPDLPVLAISLHDERLYAPRAIQAGARGFVMKQEATEKIVAAMREILAGHVYLSEAMTRQLVDGLASGGGPAERSRLEQLSDRELEVYLLLGKGLRTRQIAEHLYLSVKTVETYCERLKVRLQLSSHADLVRDAVLWANDQGGPG